MVKKVHYSVIVFMFTATRSTLLVPTLNTVTVLALQQVVVRSRKTKMVVTSGVECSIPNQAWRAVIGILLGTTLLTWSRLVTLKGEALVL